MFVDGMGDHEAHVGRADAVADCGLAEALMAARAAGPLPPDGDRRLEAHLEGCTACAELAFELEAPVTARAPADGGARDFAELAVVAADNYVRGREIGRGGMGRVVLARDLRLGRAVAIKELLDARLQARFEREARLTARLQHPAIVSIHEAGRWPGGEPFYVMKLVAGRPLHEVIAEQATLAQRLALLSHFTIVAEAIAYAHSERVVHRDLKPHNILIGAFGETVVIDWGLAKDLDATDPTDADPASALDGGPLTAAGAGTPAYMAPEQARGEAPDEGVDIYALGATLHHVLAGAPPGQAELPVAAPAELRAIVYTAMAAERRDRYRSVGELLEELQRFQTGQLVRAHRYSARDLAARWLRRHRAGILGLVGLAAAIALVVAARRTAVAGPRCDGGPAHWAGAWDGAVRGAVVRSFAASGRPYGAATFLRVASGLDNYAARWTTMYRETCEATVVRHEQSEAVLDLRMQCLDRQLGRVRALTSLFAGAPDGELVDHAVVAVSTLDPLDACADREALAATVPLPAGPVVRAQIAALRARIHDAHALERGGKYRAALERLGPIVGDAQRLAYAPVELEAQVELAGVQEDLRDFKAEQASLRQALALAARSRDDAQLASGWIALVRALPYARPDEALALREVAELAVARAGDRGALRGALRAALGEVYLQNGQYEAAQAALQEAIALVEREPGYDELALAPKLNSLGLAWKHAGKYADARAAYQRAIAIWERRLGPDHPYVAGALTNVASLRWREGHYDEARADNLRVLAVFEGAYGRDGAAVAIPLDNLGEEEVSLGRYDDAAAHLRRAVAIDEAASGPDSTDLIPELEGLGTALAYLGQFDDAVRVIERARAIAEHGGAGARPAYAESLYSLGLVAQLRGRCGDAIALEQRALASYEQALSKEHPELVGPLLRLGQCQLALERPREAIAVLERALAIRRARGGDPADVAEAQLALGRARWARAHDDAAALALIAAAQAGFAALGPRQQARAAEAARWLAAHRGR